MKSFELALPRINENNTALIFDQLQQIEELNLDGNFYYFKLDNFVNLRNLSLCGTLFDDFNFELFKNLSNQLDELSMFIPNIDYQIITKLLNGHNFSNLISLMIDRCNIKRIEKKFIDQFSSLQILHMTKCNIETIEDNAFSNLKGLISLNLSDNLLTKLYKRDFSQLVDLKLILLVRNRIEFLENGIFSHMKSIKQINLKKK